jgi:very-short-patch-repair endonuclease
VDVARAVTDTALATDDERAVRALVSSAVQRRLCSPDRLLAELSTAPRQGSKSLRVALADVVAGARSIAEAEARDLLCARRMIPPFDINAAVRDRDGVVVAVADFLWRQLRAVVEIDSREFHFDEVSWKATMARHNRLTRLGYAVAHYPPSEVRRRGPAWAAEVEAWLVERRRELIDPRG